jgi:CBS domain-containing protein
LSVVLRVRDAMTDKPVTLPETATVKDAVSIMASKDIGSVLVVNDKGELVGIFTERDLVKRVIAKGLDPSTTLLKDVMTRNPITVNTESPLEEAARIMERRRIRHLPVTDEEGRLVGIISMRDVEAALL